MTINKIIIEILKELQDSKYILKEQAEQAQIVINKKQLVAITEDSIKLADTIELNDKILPTESAPVNTIENNKTLELFRRLKKHIIRLNHVGISYFCSNIQNEIQKYKEFLQSSEFKFYEEISGDPYQRWFFVGDIHNWENSLVEVVLNTSPTPAYRYWHPQFQIDIDTNLTIQELDEIAKECFGEDFWKWNIDVPNYGIVLAMGLFVQINGTKLAIGVGTNLRNTKYHREILLKEVI